MLELYEIMLIVVIVFFTILLGYTCRFSNKICKRKNEE